MSRVDGDLSKIESGPCSLSWDGRLLGHTMDGMHLSTPLDIRKRQVDEFGGSPVELIYQGEALELKTTLAEKTLQRLRDIFLFGYRMSAAQGWGRLPGLLGRNFAKALRLHPLEVADGNTGSDVVFYKAVLVSVEEIQFGSPTADRLFGVTWTAIIDESRSDGFLGQIGGGGASNSAPTISAPSEASVEEDEPLIFSGDLAIEVDDLDENDQQATATVDHGTLTLGSTDGLDFSIGDGIGDEAMAFSGSLAAVQAAFDLFAFQPEEGFTGTATILLTLDDGQGGEAMATIEVAVGANPDIFGLIGGGVFHLIGGDLLSIGE